MTQENNGQVDWDMAVLVLALDDDEEQRRQSAVQVYNALGAAELGHDRGTG